MVKKHTFQLFESSKPQPKTRGSGDVYMSDDFLPTGSWYHGCALLIFSVLSDSSISGENKQQDQKRVRVSCSWQILYTYSWWMMITWWWSLEKKLMMLKKMMIMMTIGCSCRMSNISSIDPPTCNLKWTLLGPLRPSLRQLSKMPHWALCTGWFLLIGGSTIIRYIDEKTFF